MSQILHDIYFYFIRQPSPGSLPVSSILCPQKHSQVNRFVLFQPNILSSLINILQIPYQGIPGYCSAFHIYSLSLFIRSSTSPARLCWNLTLIISLEVMRGGESNTGCFSEKQPWQHLRAQGSTGSSSGRVDSCAGSEGSGGPQS